jgi:two-component system NarL family sensor kinase
VISPAEYIAAICVFLTLAIGIILFVILYQRRVINHQIQMREFNRQKQLELMKASIEGEEEERMRIATELHDDVGATLSSIRLFLTQAEQHPGDTQLISYSKSVLDESIRKVRDLSHQLQPRTLQYLGLAKALESFTEMISRSGSLRVEYEQEGEEWPEPEPQAALSVYRIVQELINNIVKHADASWIRLTTHTHDGKHCITIMHDGNGLTEATYQEQLFKKGAIGLKNIENRLKSSDLSLIFPEQTEDVYTITVCLPT